MKMIQFILILILLLLIMVPSLFSQQLSVKEGYILYNGDPYWAAISNDGKKVDLIRPAPEITNNFSQNQRSELQEYKVQHKATMTPEIFKSSINQSLAFSYEPLKATLSNQKIESLKSIATQYKSGQINNIIIQSNQDAQSYESVELVYNRLEACIDLLKIYGVPASNIRSEVVSQNTDNGQVTISYQ